jgi:hypothetical protein
MPPALLLNGADPLVLPAGRAPYTGPRLCRLGRQGRQSYRSNRVFFGRVFPTGGGGQRYLYGHGQRRDRLPPSPAGGDHRRRPAPLSSRRMKTLPDLDDGPRRTPAAAGYLDSTASRPPFLSPTPSRSTKPMLAEIARRGPHHRHALRLPCLL